MRASVVRNGYQYRTGRSTRETDMSEVATAETAPRTSLGVSSVWRHRQPDGAGRWRSRDAPSTAWQIARGQGRRLCREVWRGQGHDSIDDLIASPDIDAIYLTTPHNTHSPTCARPLRRASTCSARRRSRSTPTSSTRRARLPLTPMASWLHGTPCTIPCTCPLYKEARVRRVGRVTSVPCQPRARRTSGPTRTTT